MVLYPQADIFSFTRDRYLIDQLMKVQIVNEVNKDFVIEALRSIAELITYGDQHDAAYFEFFMEKQVMGEFDEVVSFPLYVEAIRFAFHEESMIRTAVRALTLNVYHVGDDAVNRFVSRAPHADYFLNLVNFFQDQCTNLNMLVSNSSKNMGLESTSSIFSAVDEIEDNLYYFSDVVSAGIPDVGRLIMDNILKLLIFPLILPSLRTGAINEPRLGAVTALYLLCCILRIVKIKDLANTVAAALLCRTETFTQNSEAKRNGYMSGHDSADAASRNAEINHRSESNAGSLQVTIPAPSSSQSQLANGGFGHDCGSTQCAPREALLSFVTTGDDMLVSGSLSVLATLLQTKELDESMVDALGILPQRKQHKKKLLQALVGEESGEEQLFSESSVVKDGFSSELDVYLQKLKDYGVSCASPEVGPSPRVYRFQVLDALVSLFCRSNISAETLWDGGWLLRQLLPHSEAEFKSHHLRLLKDSFHDCSQRVLEETRGTWPDLLPKVFCDEWRNCKRAIEASSPRKDPKYMLRSPHESACEEPTTSESSFTTGERMCETVKVFVLLHHLHIFSLGKVLPDQPPILSPLDIPEKSRAKTAGVNPPGPKINTEINLVDAVPCRIAFERGKERHFYFLAVSMGSSGWLILAEELPMKTRRGIVRVAAPLAGCNPRIDDKHSRWLHLRVRPSSFPFTDTAKYTVHGKVKSKALVDGRWTLAFQNEESCKYALCMILEEVKFQSQEVERSLKPLLELDRSLDYSRLQRIESVKITS
ncbi:hypothetical protein RD792_010958 [Penstemon davidsonii]|uniref:FPL domain-containing protein n=1 Tax=Penstemon davidsonii TaxID=160366 RepID=A0ABR0D4E5_9LAMI|nr:hypothetical protein RD792_010958 [Penstemon davidsonii]